MPSPAHGGRHLRRSAALAFLLLGAAAARPPALSAQGAPADTLAEARRLRDAARLADAASLLAAYAAAHPENVPAARLLAETRYWLRDDDGARAVYEAALARHPGDAPLRHDFARFLLETGAPARARAVLAPLAEADDAPAQALLGTLAYWDGDYTLARRRFTRALALQPELPDVRRQLAELDALARPWLRAGVTLRHDDQPLDRLQGELAAGWFATPLLSLTARAAVERADASDLAPTLASGEAAFAHYAPALRLESEAAVGVLRHDVSDASDWTGRLALGLRLPRGVVLRARAARAPYLHTTASLAELVMTESVSGVVGWTDPRGWLGEAAVQRDRYPDDNAVTSAHLWLLAPLARDANGALHLGYAFGAQDARESRFQLARPGQPLPPDAPGFDATGRYMPYWTPADLRSHTLLVAGRLRVSSGAALQLNGAVGRATERAPWWQVLPATATAPATVQRAFADRAFTPLQLRAALDASLGARAQLGVSAEHQRTAYWAGTVAGVQLAYRFAPRAARP